MLMEIYSIIRASDPCFANPDLDEKWMPVGNIFFPLILVYPWISCLDDFPPTTDKLRLKRQLWVKETFQI
jgi:hypothetical protein